MGMEALVKMWEDQAATADKVTNAISDPSASDMKLEDLEAHLNSLKEMFIQKQNDGQYEPTYSSVIVRFHQNWPCRVKMSWMEGMNARKVLKEEIVQNQVKKQI